ncbi:ATP-binding protein [Asticcacaulis sp. YBE204]|uniref:sensor histidine kinase n=1 Tax=Asticcacaulis sp. YBE204 TaxID=1282363 RepID=UPI0003C3F123|nr:ATP-binding protein [Asticcacaulis sp. YBE204]ESQ79131.1 histidine kinase [Asticcacaulis sp. YBE204]
MSLFAPLATGRTLPVAERRGEAKPNILIVDDRWQNLLATEALLKPLGADITTAESGEAALDLVLEREFAIVLLDVQMPGMDGFETARLMKTRPSMQGVPIIFVTAISKEDHFATEAAAIGAVDYIFKPINPDILKSKVSVYLDLYLQRQEILQLNTTLRQSNEELERFAYVCSHDMKEPVRMMNIYAGFLAEDAGDQLDEDGRRYLQYIRDNAVRLNKMIGDILTFSRVGREDIQIEAVDCQQIFEEVRAEFAETIGFRKARVTSGGLPTMHTSPTLIRVLLQNLIGNALKFQDGRRQPEIHVSAHHDGAFCRFDVKDNGIGIDPAYADRIFMIFKRLHSEDEYPGTGIGLSTCRKFVRLYGGDITFSSVPGEGSTFSFTLPDKKVA